MSQLHTNQRQAIDWAVQQKVDVISMSFALSQEDEKVRESISVAAKHGIVLTCSTHDEGSKVTEAYPASYKSQLGEELRKSLIVLAACDEYGKLLRHIEEDRYDYKLRGQNVPAGSVPFVTSPET